MTMFVNALEVFGLGYFLGLITPLVIGIIVTVSEKKN